MQDIWAVLFGTAVGFTIAGLLASLYDIVTQRRLSFAMQGKPPACVIIVHVERAYIQCKKALVRWRVWDAASHVSQADLPTVGEMMQRLTDGQFDGSAYDAAYPERMKHTMY